MRVKPLLFRVATLLLGLTSACGDGGDGTVVILPSQTLSEPVPQENNDWWSYTRAPTYEVIRNAVDVPMRDGVTLGCEITRPALDGAPADGQFPGLVVEFTPYVLLAGKFREEADFFATRGYNTLVCTLRGTGRSGGAWLHAMSSQDGRDAHDLVEWLATQPFADGRVGQFGESYGGQTSYGAAVEGATHLRAVAPMQPPGDLYRDVIYPGGIKSTEGGSIDNWPGIAAGLSAGAIDTAAEYAVARAHPTYDDYWQDRAIVERVGEIAIPVLTIGGWLDGYFRSGTLASIEALPERTWAIYGPWPHNYVVALCDCPAVPLPSGVLLAWFDHWVMDLPDVPIPATPTFVSFEGPRGTGAGWRKVTGWDPTGSGAPRFLLGANGSLGAAATGPATVSFYEPDSPDALSGEATFTSNALARDEVLLGHPTLVLRASLDAPDAHFYIELLDVAADGTEVLVNDGFLAASHHLSHTDPVPVEPGVETDYQIPIRAQHYRFAAGHRVRVRVSAGEPVRLVPVDVPVEVTLHVGGPSTLRLPGFRDL